MASSKNTDRAARESRERLRLYTARQQVHTHQISRRRRDNVLGLVGLAIVAALAAGTQVAYFTLGPGTPTPVPSDSASATPNPQGQNIGTIPDPSVAEGRTWTGTLTLNKVQLGITLDGAAAPQGTASFVTDARSGYFVGKTCHRLLTTESAEVIQCGSLNGDGGSDPGYQFGPVENAPADGIYPAGTIALARGTTEFSQDHQFFITTKDSSLGSAASGYTVIGTVTSGLDSLVKDITSAGVAKGAADPTDGPPSTPTSITAVTVK